jgi:two-component system, NarL family, response regulator DevR
VEKLKIFLVDDHPVILEGIRALLERHDDIEVVGEATTAAGAIHHIKALRPALVIVDITLVESNGV